MDENMEVGTAVESERPVEKQYTDVQVNDIVKREKARAAERARQEMQVQHQAEIDRLRTGSFEFPQSMDREAFKKEVLEGLMSDLKAKAEQAEYDRAVGELNKIADQYHLKMGKGSELFDDFNEVTGDFEFDKFSQVAMLAGQMENTPEIIYELTRNPSKLAEIDALVQRSPKLAMKQLERLQNSISENMQAKTNNVSAPAPLSQPKSSTVGQGNGPMTLKDMKSAPWARG